MHKILGTFRARKNCLSTKVKADLVWQQHFPAIVSCVQYDRVPIVSYSLLMDYTDRFIHCTTFLCPLHGSLYCINIFIHVRITTYYFSHILMSIT